MDDLLEISAVRAERPVRMKVRDAATGQVKSVDYVLFEVDGGGRERFMDDMLGRVESVGTDGKVDQVKTFVGMYAVLLVGSLFELIEAGPPRTMRPVTYEEIQALPAPAQQALYDAAVLLGGLDKGAVEEAKKNSPGTSSNGSTLPPDSTDPLGGASETSDPANS